MSYKRENANSNKRYARTIDQFFGINLAYGKCDQPPSFSYGCDFHFVYGKPELRPGCRKNDLRSYSGSIDGLFSITIGGLELLGVAKNNILSVYPIEDVLAGVRKYYTWQELYDKYSWEDLEEKTWDDLFNGDNNP